MVSYNSRNFFFSFFSLVLFILGSVLLIAGVVFQFGLIDDSYLKEINIAKAPLFLISVGLIMLVIAIFAYCAATSENYYLLMSFGVFMIGIFIIGLTGAVLLFMRMTQLQNQYEDKINSTMYRYDTNVGYKHYWDNVQTKLQCCGVSGPADWEAIGKKTIPTSCCKNVTFDCNESNAFSDGCYSLVLEEFKRESFKIGNSTAMLSIIHVIVIYLIFHYARNVRRNNCSRQEFSYYDMQKSVVPLINKV